MAIPSAPENVYMEGNTIFWDEVVGATSYNLYYKKNKAPNEYFETLNNWDVNVYLDTGSAYIVEDQVHLSNKQGVVAAVDIRYDYMPASSSNYDISIDVTDYHAENTNEGMNAEFRMLSNSNSDFARVEFYQDKPTVYRINGYIYTNDTTRQNVFINVSTRPTGKRIQRDGTTILLYYTIGAGWVLITSYDCDTNAQGLNQPWLKAHHRVQNGGYVRYDNFIIEPSVYDSGTQITGITALCYTVPFIAGDFYCFEVTAVNDDGESDPSIEIYGITEEQGIFTIQEIEKLHETKEIDSLYSLQEINELFLVSKSESFTKTTEQPSYGTQINTNHPLNNGLIAYWPLNEGSGDIIHDVTSNVDDGDLINSILWSTNDRGYVLQFNGANQYANFPGINLDTTGPISVSFWNYVATENLQKASAFGGVGINWISDRFQAHVPYSDKILYWDFGTESGAGRITADYTNYLDKWTHIVLMSEGKGGSFKSIFLDGTLVNSLGVSDGPDGIVNFDIGRCYFTATTIQYHKGKIENFYIWNRTLTDGYIQELYEDPYCLFGMSGDLSVKEIKKLHTTKELSQLYTPIALAEA